MKPAKRKRLFSFFAVLLISVLLAGTPAIAYSKIETGESYTYDEKGNDVSIPDAYMFKEAVPLADDQQLAAENAQDLFISADGKIYVADTANNRILIFGGDFRFQKSLSTIADGEGTSELNQPEGVYVYQNGDLLIADTQNNRVVRCDEDGNAKLVIGLPENMTGVSDKNAFLPIKISADSIGRIYIVAKNMNNGVIQLDSQGKFMGFIGAPRVQPDLFTLLLRKFYTKAQKAQLQQFVPTEYNSIQMDSGDFLWGTISSLDSEDITNAVQSHDRSGTTTPVRRLNAMGNDILKRNGAYAPLGDLLFEEDEPSRIVDVAVGSNGIYSLLDQTKGHVFTYDDNGNLLYVWGSTGDKISNFQLPSAISYRGSSILVLDSGLSRILIFEPTAYGKKVLEAEGCQFNGDYERAYTLWSQVAEENTNFKYAFVGLGNAKLSEKKYEEAIKFFRYADDQENYSKTLLLIRKQKIQKYFPFVLEGILVFAALLIVFAVGRRFWRYYKGN